MALPSHGLAPTLCLRLQRGCGVRGWGRDGLGNGGAGKGREGAEGVDVDYAQIHQLYEESGGFGTLLSITTDSDDAGWDHESLRLLDAVDLPSEQAQERGLLGPVMRGNARCAGP